MDNLRLSNLKNLRFFSWLIQGWISDKYNSRAPVVVVMLLLSSGALVPFFGTPSIHLLIIMIPITGFLLGGPANMISSAIAADLGGKVKGR